MILVLDDTSCHQGYYAEVGVTESNKETQKTALLRKYKAGSITVWPEVPGGKGGNMVMD